MANYATIPVIVACILVDAFFLSGFYVGSKLLIAATVLTLLMMNGAFLYIVMCVVTFIELGDRNSL
jgi:hypothetical protein